MATTYTYGSQVWGSVALNAQPIVIDNTNSTFSFDVDSVHYEIAIPFGTYKTDRDHFTSELIDPINNQLVLASAPVFVRLGGVHIDNHIDVLVIEHNDKTASHTIDNFGGTALNVIFGTIQFTFPPRTI